MYEYDPNKVSMSRLRLAYDLNDHYAEIVKAKLWPYALFPLELWQNTYTLFWRGFADTVALFYSINSPEFPEHNIAEEKYFHTHLYAQDMENLFSMLASRIHVNALREGLRYILSMTYENDDAILFQDKMAFLFEKLSKIEKNTDYNFASRTTETAFKSLMEEKIFSVPPPGYFFVSQMYPDTILVDTVSAIQQINLLRIPFKTEVKGIPYTLVRSVIDSLEKEAQTTGISVSQLQTQDTAPPSTGSRKDIERINATRQACDELVKELLLERQSFENNKDSWVQGLLFDNGKTNWKTFERALAARLGAKPHIVTARAGWKEVPDILKHMGRVREQ